MGVTWAGSASPLGNRSAMFDDTIIVATTSATVTRGQLLKVTGDGTVGPTTAITDIPIGVATHDAASGANVTMWPLVQPFELVASAAVTAGQVVEPSTVAGQVKVATTGTRLGVALTTFAGSPLRGYVLACASAVS
jgi:Uncharacterized conserved protein (DUF2190)